MITALRSAIFIIGKVVVTILYGILLIFILPLPKLPRHRIIISWCWVVLQWLRLTCGVRYRIIGAEHINRSSAKVYLSKHQSAWETFMLQYILFPATTILKKELLHIPIFGWGLRCLQPISIDRTNPREALKKVKSEGLAKLAEGVNVLLFPEGTRTRPTERGKYARSGAEIAVTAGVDVVPVAVNAGHCWPPKRHLKFPGLITVHFGPPISTQDKSSREVIEAVELWIENRMAELEAERLEAVL